MTNTSRYNNVTKGNREGKPWFANALGNASKRNTIFYTKQFLRCRTQSAEVKY